MTIDDKIKDEKLQYNIREAAKTSALLWGKIDKYENLTGKEILPPDQSRVIEEAKFTYSPLGKAKNKLKIWKTNKSSWRSRNKTTWSFKNFKIRRELKSRFNRRTFSKKYEKW